MYARKLGARRKSLSAAAMPLRKIDRRETATISRCSLSMIRGKRRNKKKQKNVKRNKTNGFWSLLNSSNLPKKPDDIAAAGNRDALLIGAQPHPPTSPKACSIGLTP